MNKIFANSLVRRHCKWFSKSKVHFFDSRSLSALTVETLKQQQAEKLKTYNRDYHQAHNKASECKRCNKTFSSVAALRRHQAQKPQAQAATSNKDHSKVQR